MTSGHYEVVRKQQTLYNQEGDFLAIAIRHIADGQALVSSIPKQSLVLLSAANLEVKRGDKLLKVSEVNDIQPIVQIKAATDQKAQIIADLSQYQLSSKYSVVIIDIGNNDIDAGIVMGIYQQGAAVLDSEPAQYLSESQTLERAFSFNDVLPQPWMKVGELLVFKVFSKVSYALVTRSSTVIRKGAIVAKP